MKIVAISDMHGQLPEVPDCDLLLIAGDICPVEDHRVSFQAKWLDREFRGWLGSLTHVRKVVGIAGNHDFIFQQSPDFVPDDLPWTYLLDQLTEFEGLRIWGSPWQPWFFDWAFNLQPDELRDKWALIPEGIDILVVHGPPFGFGDAVQRGKDDIELCGCKHLLARIQELKPRLVVFGHIHEGRGQWQLGPTTLANVTLLDLRYQPVYRPWVFEGI